MILIDCYRFFHSPWPRTGQGSYKPSPPLYLLEGITWRAFNRRFGLIQILFINSDRSTTLLFTFTYQPPLYLLTITNYPPASTTFTTFMSPHSLASPAIELWTGPRHTARLPLHETSIGIGSCCSYFASLSLYFITAFTLGGDGVMPNPLPLFYQHRINLPTTHLNHYTCHRPRTSWSA